MFMAGLIVLIAFVTFRAPDTPRPEQGLLHAALAQRGELSPCTRAVALLFVGVSWAWAIGTIIHFMVGMLAPSDPQRPLPSVGDFTRLFGPWIVFATVAVPLIVAAATNWLKTRQIWTLTAPDPRVSPVRTAGNHLYVALVSPLAELSARLGWGVLIVIGMI
jgi:PAT family beta-lactamase induction signal transducer AmpG